MNRRQKERGEDRISSLPDKILCRILSFLPDTKNAVATFTLSRRWIDLWTRFPVLQFDYKDNRGGGDVEAFVRFVDKLICRNISPNIEKFRLHYEKSGGTHLFRVNDWVQTAISRKVIELDLQLFFRDNDACEIGLWLLHCESIEVLKIDMDVRLRMPNLKCFINLKKFYIKLEDADNELTSNLFSSLPQLEELWVSLGNMACCSHLNIVAPVLKVLSFRGWDACEAPEELKVLIVAPMLEHISLEDDWLYSYTLEQISSNVQAKINIGTRYMRFDCRYIDYDDIEYRIVKLIWGLSSAKYLSISESTMEAAYVGRVGNLPMFHGLTKLELFVDPCMWILLLHFLKRAPNLEILVLNMKVEIRGPIKIKGVQLLKYIMKNAKVLKKLTVNSVEFF